jgi:hypothetical protein
LSAYIALGTSGNQETAAGFHRQLMSKQLMLVDSRVRSMIYKRLREIVSDEGMTYLEHISMTYASDDPVSDIPRLEGVRARPDLSPAMQSNLRLKIIAQCLKISQIDKAEALVQAMREGQPPDPDRTANAVYMLAEHYRRAGKLDLARPLLKEVVESFIQTHWAKIAQARLSKMTEPVPAG